MGLSKNYFTRFYSRETGIGFWAYVTRLRIDKAKLLLETSSLPMAEICARVGYDDVSYFSHRFKSLEGCRPANSARRASPAGDHIHLPPGHIGPCLSRSAHARRKA